MKQGVAIRESVRRPAGSHFWARLCAVAWVGALILGANTLFPLEWSHPYCNNPTDGPAWAAYGLPLPYRGFSGVSSLAFDIMPHALLANVLLLAALAYPLIRRAEGRLARIGRLTVAVATFLGALLLTLCLAALWFDVATGFIVGTLGSGHDSYWTYRPIGISPGGHVTTCTPSQFWFGPVAP